MITVQLKEEDLAEAYKLHRRWGPWMWSINCLSTALYVGVALWLILWLPEFLSIAIALIVMAIVLWIFLAYAKFILPLQIARRRYRQQKRLQRSQSFSWDDSALSTESETGMAHTPWSDFLKWRENEYLLLLYMSRGLFTIIPKRVFSNSHEIASFRQVLQQRIATEGKWRRNTNGKEHAEAAD